MAVLYGRNSNSIIVRWKMFNRFNCCLRLWINDTQTRCVLLHVNCFVKKLGMAPKKKKKITNVVFSCGFLFLQQQLN